MTFSGEKQPYFAHQLTLRLRSVTVAILDFVQGNEFNKNLALATNIAKSVRLYTDFMSTSIQGFYAEAN